MQIAREKTIIAFGYHDPEGARNWVIAKGLEAHGFRLLQCRTEKRGFLPKCTALTRTYRKQKKEGTIVLLPFLGHYMVPLAWLLTRYPRKILVLDFFFPLYDAYVHDRKLLHPWHPRALLLRLCDLLAAHLPDLILLDTEEHKEFVAKTYHVRSEKILVIPVGGRTDIFHPQEEPRNPIFTVEFHGTFIPLQGIETILETAKLLEGQGEKMEFLLIGKGQTYPAMRKLAQTLNLTSVRFLEFQTPEEINRIMNRADVCLGIFGTTEKTDRVLPTKAYEILLAGRPLITARTSAAQRILTDRVNVLLSKPGDSRELAERILELKQNSELRSMIAKNGHALAQKVFQPQSIVIPLVQKLTP